MTATQVLGEGTRPLVADAAGGAPASPADDRQYFAGCNQPVDFVLLDVQYLFGPLTPTPNTTLAEAVERIAGQP